MEVILKFEKTSNPVFSEGRDLQGQMPSMPRTDSMFDRPEAKRPAKKEDNKSSMLHGQKNTGHQAKDSKGVTALDTTTQHEGIPNLHFYFEAPGDFQPVGEGG